MMASALNNECSNSKEQSVNNNKKILPKI